jgi:cytochrome c-type biogenesis protein
MLRGPISSDPGLIAAFGAGMLSFISPCVLPLVPGYLSLMSGVSVAQLETPTSEARVRLFRSTLLFVVGFTLVFVALGAAASAVGAFLLRNLDAFTRIAGALIIIMGLFLAGVVSIPALQRERRLHASVGKLGVFAPPIMGMAFAFGWTPCIGPVLGPILALAASEGTLARGVALLFAYSLGLAVPFVVSGIALEQLTGTFGWIKRHYRAINLASGLVLAIFGFIMLTNSLGSISSWIITAMDKLHLTFLTKI